MIKQFDFKQLKYLTMIGEMGKNNFADQWKPDRKSPKWMKIQNQLVK